MSDIFSLFSSVGNNLSNNENDVMNVKKELFKRGYYTKPVENGIIDVDTTNAIKSFQKDNNLKVDGLMNPRGETENAIKSDLGYDNTDRARRNQIINNANDFKFYLKSEPRGFLDKVSDNIHGWFADELDRPEKSQVKRYEGVIEEHSKSIGVDHDLVKSVMHLENIRGWYDGIAAEYDMDKSIQPMNIRPDIWSGLNGYSRSDFRVPYKNIEAGTELIKRISDRVPDKDIAKIGTLYQSLGATAVSQYGQKVKDIYERKPWNRNK